MVKALEVRFGAVPDGVAAALEAIAELDQLDELHTRAIVVESLAAFEELLPSPA